jgi:hypothetical protein
MSSDYNSAGYDAHSYTKGPVEPVARLIEVNRVRAGQGRFFSHEMSGRQQSNLLNWNPSLLASGRATQVAGQ